MASPWEESSDIEAFPANFWAAEEAKGAIFRLGTPPFSAPLGHRDKVDEALLRNGRGQRPHQEQRRNSDKDAHCEAVFGGISPEEKLFLTAGMAHEGGPLPCSSPPRPFDQRPLHQPHRQSRCEMPRYGHIVGMGGGSHHVGVHHRPSCRQRQRGRAGPALDGPGDGGKTAGNDFSGGQSYGGGFAGCGEIPGGETVTASPKSSISSAESWRGGGGLVDNRTAAVWELDSTGEGDGRLPGERKRKRGMETTAENGFGLRQLQMICHRESSASLGNNVLSIQELKKLLLCDSMELESAGTSAKEEIRKKEENIMQLLQLLNMTSIERDEAKDQLKELLNKIAVLQPCPLERPSWLSYLRSEGPSAELTSCNSGITEIDTPSCTHSYELDSYSAVRPHSDLVSAELSNVRSIADLSNIAMSHQPLLPGYSSSTAMELSTGTAKFDRASAIIDSLVMNKPLPEKGKLLQAMMEAGPLLQTLLVAGHVPQWRNPPPLKPFQMPPVTAKACEYGTFDQNAILDPNFLVQSSARAFHYQNSLVASRVYAASSMKTSSLGALCMRVPMLSACESSYKVPIGKRQKI